MSTRVVISLTETPEKLKSTVSVDLHKEGHTKQELKQAKSLNQHVCEWLGKEVKQPTLCGVNMAARFEVVFIECNGGVEINTSLDIDEAGYTEKERLTAYRLQQLVFAWIDERNGKRVLPANQNHVH